MGSWSPGVIFLFLQLAIQTADEREDQLEEDDADETEQEKEHSSLGIVLHLLCDFREETETVQHNSEHNTHDAVHNVHDGASPGPDLLLQVHPSSDDNADRNDLQSRAASKNDGEESEQDRTSQKDEHPVMEAGLEAEEQEASADNEGEALVGEVFLVVDHVVDNDGEHGDHDAHSNDSNNDNRGVLAFVAEQGRVVSPGKFAPWLLNTIERLEANTGENNEEGEESHTEEGEGAVPRDGALDEGVEKVAEGENRDQNPNHQDLENVADGNVSIVDKALEREHIDVEFECEGETAQDGDHGFNPFNVDVLESANDENGCGKERDETDLLEVSAHATALVDTMESVAEDEQNEEENDNGGGASAFSTLVTMAFAGAGIVRLT